MTSDYKLILTSVISEITEVRLYEETIDHIKDGHPEVPIELPSIYGAVLGTVTNPTHVEVGGRANTFVYVDGNSTNASGDALRVPVKVIQGTSALVKTAFFATPENPPPVVWRKPK